MYAALFLVPWVLMYALSTLVMNHHDHGAPFQQPQFTPERTVAIESSFPAQATREEMAEQLLEELELPGRHDLGRVRDDGTLVINRHFPTGQRRITFDPKTRLAHIEQTTYDGTKVLSQLHRRRGYASPFLKDDLWGLSVDAFVIALLFWLISGLWMWWELRITRRLGAAALLAGSVAFAIFMVTL